MSRDQFDWRKDTDGTYKHEARGYAATITINPDGTATLAIVGPGAPADAAYPTRRNAMTAYKHFLESKPVA